MASEIKDSIPCFPSDRAWAKPESEEKKKKNTPTEGVFRSFVHSNSLPAPAGQQVSWQEKK